MVKKPNLVYTIAIDPPGSGGTRQMAKMLAASLVRTYFDGDVLVFRNSAQPLFLTPRQGVEEVYIELPEVAKIVNSGLGDAGLIGRPWLTSGDEVNQGVGLMNTEPQTALATGEREWGKAQADALARVAMSWKYRARHYIKAEEYGWVMFIDADSLALRNIDHLLPAINWCETAEPTWHVERATNKEGHTRELAGPYVGLNERGDAELLYQPERGRKSIDEVFSAYLRESLNAGRDVQMRDGINSGTWAVRGTRFREVMEAWEKIEATPPRRVTQWTEQGAWNRLIDDIRRKDIGKPDTGVDDGKWQLGNQREVVPSLRARPFEAGEVQFPLHLDKDWKRYKDAAILHAVGVTTNEKIEFLFGMFMQRFYGDAGTTLVNILEI